MSARIVCSGTRPSWYISVRAISEPPRRPETWIFTPFAPERIALGDRALFVDYVDGAGNSKLTNAFIERRLACRSTARNLRSLQRILDKMDET